MRKKILIHAPPSDAVTFDASNRNLYTHYTPIIEPHLARQFLHLPPQNLVRTQLVINQFQTPSSKPQSQSLELANDQSVDIDKLLNLCEEALRKDGCEIY